MILFEAEDAIGVSRLNREIMDFLAIAEPAVTMEIKEAALHHSLKEAGYKIRIDCNGWYIEW